MDNKLTPSEALEILRQKFTSGNSVPVERAMITRAEYEALAETVLDADAVYELIEEVKHSRRLREKVKLTPEEIDEIWLKHNPLTADHMEFASVVIAAHEAKQSGGV